MEAPRSPRAVRINLGSAFNTALGPGDLKFNFTPTTGELISGAVNYVAGNANFNGDSGIDGADFLIWQRNLGRTSGATLAQGDADGNGAVNGADLAIWSSGYGSAVPQAAGCSGRSRTDLGRPGGLFAAMAVTMRTARRPGRA